MKFPGFITTIFWIFTIRSWQICYSFNCRMNSRDFRVLLLYEWKGKHNAAAAAQNVNAAFGDNSVNEHTIRHWYSKFETGVESLTNKHRGRPETGVKNNVLHEIVGKNPGNYRTFPNISREFLGDFTKLN